MTTAIYIYILYMCVFKNVFDKNPLLLPNPPVLDQLLASQSPNMKSSENLEIQSDRM